ncbi:hypothetical protein C922_04755 [Plasmodium inui San Antonio 1]|uniref:Uncharacterized protein n=1 Tax=Plasmodium inui San Antonio 1 TaxID=1237626 RepID=W7AI07_9APIC|nr:hypothetical protein C922_04755 [Plasmodium inui San Antonio 1]EUD64911.1 hypothetical protein C922_04755 [Plasmodium inui San Antonio 1]
MSKPKILICQIKSVGDIKGWSLKGIESCRKKIFGYAGNMPGEKQWIKPLIGKSMQNYYFPSKYLHLDFNLKEYMRMQTVRFKKKETDDSLIKLQKCINLIIENKDKVEEFLAKIPKELYLENQSLKDFYSLYLTVFPDHKRQEEEKSQHQEEYRHEEKYHHKRALSPDDLRELNLHEHKFSWFSPRGESGRETQGDKSNFGDSPSCKQDGSESRNYVNRSRKLEEKKVILEEKEESEMAQNVCEEVTAHTNSYDKIIFARTKGRLSFKRIILGENAPTDGDKPLTRLNCGKEVNTTGQKLHYIDCDVNIGLEERQEKTQAEMEEHERSKNHFLDLLNQSEHLQNTFSIRNRFIDPLYLRRRYSFIDKLTKKKIKKEKYRTYRRHFIKHADEKEMWPDNKGLLNKVYPNPYS